MESVDIAKPFLKWVGGKTQIIDHVISRFPQEIHNYYEPFVGGGSVLLAILSHQQCGNIHVSGTIYASDINAHLIGLYKNIQTNVDALILELRTLCAEYAECIGAEVNRKASTLDEAKTSPESYYFWIRAKFNALLPAERTGIQASAMFLFMNKTCFRGVYREGPRGFNVPFGNYKNPAIFDETHLRAISALIQPVVFSNLSFETALLSIEPGDFVYMDPPYAPENEKSFVSYTADGFDAEKHKTLFRLSKQMAQNNIGVVLSNADVPIVRAAFPPELYHTQIISCRRKIHSKSPDARADEVLITNNSSGLWSCKAT